MPARSDRSAAQQGATGRNKQKNGPAPLDLYLNPDRHLSERQKTAIELLLRGFSDAQVAAEIGVDRGSVYRWRQHAGFQRELERQRQQIWQRSAGQLHAMVEPALEELRQQLAGDDPKTRLRAAAILLRFANPTRLARAARITNNERDNEDDAFAAMKAYIDAPMPGQPGAPDDLIDELDEEDDDTT